MNDSTIPSSSVQKSLIDTQKRLKESEKYLDNIAKVVNIRKR
ncbi:hypothetical protein [Priestia megaterium]|nr:hypothetical protein [Priestia megaterium]